MNVIEPARYQGRPKPRRWWPYAVIPAAILILAGSVNYLRPLPASRATVHVSVPVAATPVVQWPSAGQAAIAAERYGLLDTSGNQTPLATASTAKVITALCVLQRAPLSPGQTGPTYTVDADDVTTYDAYVAQDGSLLPVRQGEQITEYQALEALMIPSANNIADSLVRWVFGSQSAYATYASEYLQQHGLDNTRIGTDASGFDPSTTSTASDLTQLGLLALKNPVLVAIAGQEATVLPIAGRVTNYDTVLGQNGITGLKTGNNDADPGAFIFTATTTIGDLTIPLAGAVIGASSLNAALQESSQLAGSLEHGFEQVTVATAGRSVGTMRAAWGAAAPIVPVDSVRIVRWKATPVTASSHTDTHIRSGNIGSLKASAGPSNAHTSLKLGRPLAPPSFWWRLTRH